MTAPHPWHMFDEEHGLEVRQVTGVKSANRWDVRDPTGKIIPLNDAEFEQLRSEGPNPKGLPG